jgi:F-type H+-transporting ATPase subunit b
MEALQNLGIDFKILLTQIFNFGLTVGILTFLVYKPILKVLNERKQKIADSVKNAEEIEDMKAKAQEMFDGKIEEAKKEMDQILTRAKKDAEQMRKEIVDKANEKAKEIVDKAHLVTAQEKESLLASVRQEMVVLVLQASEKVLEEKGSVDQKTVEKILSNL